MTRKTPAYALAAIARHSEAVKYTAELIRVKATVPVENQAAHVRDGFPALWIAGLEGQRYALEALLHHAGCYYGFGYVNPADGKGADSEVYPWAVRFLTRT